MADDPIVELRAGKRPAARTPSEGATSPLPQSPAPGVARVCFDRRELTAILQLYGRMVASGEWRDYAIDALRDAALFSVYRRTSEMALYRIEKRPKLRAKQGQYAVVAGTGLILKRGNDLAQVLRVFEAKRFRVID